jgi:acyl-CoA thioester hydrolase
MRPPAIPLDKITALPFACRATIPDEYRDMMGHMNIRWYMLLYDEAGFAFFEQLGLTLDYYQQNHTGGFDLEHHVHYLAEVNIGATVAFYARILGQTAKRIHYMLFMVNETRGLLSSTFECVNSHADLTTRRTSPFPAFAAERMDALLAEHQSLDWDAPICGAMSA